MRPSRIKLMWCAFLSLLLIAFLLVLFAPPARDSLADDTANIAAAPADTWYLAEGSTDGTFETWVLVQNPGDTAVNVDVDFMTDTGIVKGPVLNMPPHSRSSVDAGEYVTTYDVSTRIMANADVICERSVYWDYRNGGHNSIGVTKTNNTWYMAEGATAGDFETWILVQNPSGTPVQIDMDFQTGFGEVQGPQGSIPPYSRRSYNVGDFVETYDVSTKVTASADVICERAMYWDDKLGGHCSVGVIQPDDTWYLAEGCTDGDFETWVLVQNPGENEVEVNIAFQTDTGVVAPTELREVKLPAGTRRSFNVKEYVTSYNVSTKIRSYNGDVICERAMYWDSLWTMMDIADPEMYLSIMIDRCGGHSSIGANQGYRAWYLAEGCTKGDFETWILVQNPGETEVNIDIDFMTDSGMVQGPMKKLPPRSRRSYNVAEYVETYDVSTRVTADGYIVCERAVYWDSILDDTLYGGTNIMAMYRIGGHNSIGHPSNTLLGTSR